MKKKCGFKRRHPTTYSIQKLCKKLTFTQEMLLREAQPAVLTIGLFYEVRSLR